MRCNPATPASTIAHDGLPMISAVTAASSATGKSLVPAQITAMLPGVWARAFLNGHAPRQFVMHGKLEFSSHGAGVFGSDAGDQHRCWSCSNSFGGNLHDLGRRLAGAEDDFGKTFPQGAMRVHLGKTEVSHGRGLKRAQHRVAIPCPQRPSKMVSECHGEKTEARAFNLMFKTTVGPIESEENVAYLRPETAQAIFVQFKNVLETSRQKVPFGIAQIGKAFRNEVTPRNFTFRSREFEQMELEFFIRPDEVVTKLAGSVSRVDPANPRAALETPATSWGWEVWHKYWVEERIRWYESLGLPRSSLEEYWQKPEGTGALRPGHGRYSLQVPVRHAGTGRHCRPR
jgi:hypothetical protein